MVCSWTLKRDEVDDIVDEARNLRGAMMAEIVISCTTCKIDLLSINCEQSFDEQMGVHWLLI